MQVQEAAAFYRVAAALEESGETYCVLHGWHQLGKRATTDIDVAMSPGGPAALEAALERNGWQMVQLIHLSHQGTHLHRRPRVTGPSTPLWRRPHGRGSRGRV
jgi:hypothetical protein